MFISVYALVGLISHNELLVHGHESFEISARCSVRPSVTWNDYGDTSANEWPR
jgi:hypothetical protein